MTIFGKLLGRRPAEAARAGGMEDFMLLLRVYYQASIAAQLGINNLGAFPDLRVFKQTYRVATVNNKLGTGERKACRRLMQDIYKMSDGFFDEADQSVRKRCRRVQDAQSYLVAFQGFSQELMMLMGNLMQWKMRLPGFLRGALKGMVAKQVAQVMSRNDWQDEGVRKACAAVRKYHATLGYSEQWMTEYVHTVVMLAKRERRKNNGE